MDNYEAEDSLILSALPVIHPTIHPERAGERIFSLAFRL